MFFFGLGLDDHASLQQIAHQPDVRRRIGGKFFAGLFYPAHHAAFDHDFGHTPLLHLVNELGILHRLLRRLLRADLIEHRHQHDGYHQPDRHRFYEIIQMRSSLH